MLQVARLSPKLLAEAAPLVGDFVRGQMNADGGFNDRAGASDLYYTVFGLECLMALRADLPAAKVIPYLQMFGEGVRLDLVHLACLARCWADVSKTPPENAAAIAERIERHRATDGGYNASIGARHGTVYGTFMAMGAYQDLKMAMPEAERILECIAANQTEDGAYANHPDMPVGLTSATAAAATMLRQMNQPVQDRVGQWLLERVHRDGGFLAAPQAPIPDLLSTATALHALAGLHLDFEQIKEACLDFIDTLWTPRGSFFGHWGEDILDCEYTYYGLLALGHLSL
jgi:prenyltransferase beta subunit